MKTHTTRWGKPARSPYSTSFVYHVTPRRFREQINAGGIDFHKGECGTDYEEVGTKPGNYFWKTLREARLRREQMEESFPADIWKVQAHDIALEANRCPWGGVYTTKHVAACKIFLLSFKNPEGEVLTTSQRKRVSRHRFLKRPLIWDNPQQRLLAHLPRKPEVKHRKRIRGSCLKHNFMSNTYEFPRPAVTADCIVFRFNHILKTIEVLLIKRKGEPYKGKWAFPGGFVNENEDLLVAAERELKEETTLTGVKFKAMPPVGTPHRDPRGHIITCPFVGTTKSRKLLKARDDAQTLKWWDIKKLPGLAFDHKEILIAATQNVSAPMVQHMLPATKNAFYNRYAQKSLSSAFLKLLRELDLAGKVIST